MKVKVLKSFAGYYMDGDTRRHISAGMGDVLDLPEDGHDFVKAGLVIPVKVRAESTSKKTPEKATKPRPRARRKPAAKKKTG